MISKRTHNLGFTAVELMVGIALVLLVYLAVTTFGRNLFFMSGVVRSDLGATEDGEQFFRYISPEIRSMVSSNTGAYALATAGTSTITFYSDTIGDGLRRQIRYFLSGTTLKRGVITPTGNPLTYVPANEVVTDIVRNVSNASTIPLFDYFDGAYAGTSTPLAQPVALASVRLVKISLYVGRSYGNSNGAPILFTTQVGMRNLKDNL